VQRLPQIPRRDRSVRLPRFADFQHALRVGPLPQPVQPLNRGDDAKVAGGQHVRPVQPEHQEHLGGPAAESLHRGQTLDHLVVRQ